MLWEPDKTNYSNLDNKVNSDPADETIIEVYSIYLLIFQSNRVYSGFSAILF